MSQLAPFAGRKAVRRAKEYVGRRAYTGMCQAFTVTMFGTGAVGDYDGDGDADAVDGWEKAKARGKVRTASQIHDFKKIPSGVALYWTGGSRGYGHAAVSIGGGKMVTTDAAAGGIVGIRDIEGWWARSHNFLGYAYQDGNGFVLKRIHDHARPKSKPVKVSQRKTTTYVITGKAVNVRQGPSIKTDVVKTIPRGYRFGVVGRRGDWLETSKGNFVHVDLARKA